MKNFTKRKFPLLLHSSKKLHYYFSLLWNKFTNSLYSEYHQWPLWYIVSYIFGIAFYFRFINSQSLLILPISLLAMFFLYLRKKNPVFLLIIFLLLGINIANFRLITTDTIMISEPIKLSWVRGYVKSIKRKFDGKMILVTTGNKVYKKNIVVNNLRVVTKEDLQDLKVGDYISFKASLIPASKNSKTGFNFYRNDYYQSISATAFVRNKMKVIKKSTSLKFMDQINSMRDEISQFIIKKIGQRTGSLAAALIVGKKGGIEVDDVKYIRQSGLSHIFAVSGLHLTLIAATVFFLIRYSISFSLNFTQRYNTKKIAAFFTLFVVLFYLLMTGLQISAVRAFIMIALVMISIIFDLQVDLKRSLAVAAFLILLFKPEQVFHPSFQLSFIATVSLIAAFEGYSSNIFVKEKSSNRGLFFYLCGAMLSTAIATLSTSMFILYHFKFLSIYTIFANIFASPIVSFIVMPSVVGFFALMPYLAGWVFLYPIDYGLFILLKISEFSQNLESLSITMGGYSDISLFIFSFGVLWLSLWNNKWRYFGAGLLLLSFFM